LRIGIDGRELQGRPTGTGRYLRNLLRHWTFDRHDTLLLYFNGAAPVLPVLAATGVETRIVGDGRSGGLVWQQRLLPEAARADKLDVFFSPAYECPLALQVPRVTAIHDLSFFARPHEFGPLDGLKRRLLVSATVRASAEILACSNFTRSEIAARFPESAGRVSFVPLGPDDDLAPSPPRAEARERLGATGPLVVSVGSLFERRCVPELLRAFVRVRERFARARLEIVGENRSHPHRDYEDDATQLGLGSAVRFSGFAGESFLADLYSAADVAVSLSEYEGFGLPALEALARGVPVVIGNRPSLSELFSSAAVAVEPRSPAAIGDAVVRLISEPVLREDLISRGQRLAAQFSWRRTADLTRGALERAA
jgi:glycosyltransferase involved in cell wall biosynthesis